jgi:hypothetical protein
MLRTQWLFHQPTQASPKPKAQPTLATSNKIEQRFQPLSIGFLRFHGALAENMLPLESTAEICSHFQEPS